MATANFDEILGSHHPWCSNENAIWLASTLTLRRNLERFKFPSKNGVERRKQVRTLLGNQLLQQPLLASNSGLWPAEDVSPLDKEFLFEHFLPSEALIQAHAGEGFVIGCNGSFLATLNLADHLVFHILDSRGALEEAWSKLAGIESAIGKILPYAFLPRFGFLTHNPHFCGTALHVTSFMQVPALIHTDALKGTLEKWSDEPLRLTNLQGGSENWIGDIAVIQNRYTLGCSEESIIALIRAATLKMENEEVAAREQLKRDEPSALKDKVSRAFAISAHSYQLDASEVLGAISLLKLGVAIGWVEGIDAGQLNAVFLNSRRAHLMRYNGQGTLSNDQLLHHRAEFLHHALSKASLLI